jgi:hypothetical protein
MAIRNGQALPEEMLREAAAHLVEDAAFGTQHALLRVGLRALDTRVLAMEPFFILEVGARARVANRAARVLRQALERNW